MDPLRVLPRSVLPDDLATFDVATPHHLSDQRIEHPVVCAIDGMKVAGLAQAVLRCRTATDSFVERP